MARKRKKKLPDIDNVKKTIKESGEENCQCNWSMAVECVDDLLEWINDLCAENVKLKDTLTKTIERLNKDNNVMRKQLDDMPDNTKS
jgi:hypothetical protein